MGVAAFQSFDAVGDSVKAGGCSVKAGGVGTVGALYFGPTLQAVVITSKPNDAAAAIACDLHFATPSSITCTF